MAEAVAQVAEATPVRREQKPIRGKVAAVLDEERLVLNVGTNHGVARKMVFRISGTRVIRDPDTGDELGEVEVTKIKVQVGEIKEKISIAYPYQGYDTDFFLRPIRRKFRSKGIKPSTIASAISTQYVEVAVGDLAVSD